MHVFISYFLLEMNIHLLIKLGCLSTPLHMELSRTYKKKVKQIWPLPSETHKHEKKQGYIPFPRVHTLAKAQARNTLIKYLQDT